MPPNMAGIHHEHKCLLMRVGFSQCWVKPPEFKNTVGNNSLGIITRIYEKLVESYLDSQENHQEVNLYALLLKLFLLLLSLCFSSTGQSQYKILYHINSLLDGTRFLR